MDKSVKGEGVGVQGSSPLDFMGNCFNSKLLICCSSRLNSLCTGLFHDR